MPGIGSSACKNTTGWVSPNVAKLVFVQDALTVARYGADDLLHDSNPLSGVSNFER